MSWTTLGKRRTRGFSDRRFAKRAAPTVTLPVAALGGTRYRSFGSLYRRPGPFRSGGFYGSAVRSPVERKVVDTTVAVYQINTTGSVNLLNGIATGTDYTQRIGRRVNVVSIQARGIAYIETPTATPVQMGRFMLVEDMQANGVIATTADIFNEATGTSMMNLNNRERFKVHYDKQMVFGPASTTATQTYSAGPQAYNIAVYKKCNIPMVFEGTAATIGSVSSGALYAVFIGTQVAGTADCNCAMSFRIRFIDA